jgi:hypothetical protein
MGGRARLRPNRAAGLPATLRVTLIFPLVAFVLDLLWFLSFAGFTSQADELTKIFAAFCENTLHQMRDGKRGHRAEALRIFGATEKWKWTVPFFSQVQTSLTPALK